MRPAAIPSNKLVLSARLPLISAPLLRGENRYLRRLRIRGFAVYGSFFGSFGTGGASKQTMKSLRESIFL